MVLIPTPPIRPGEPAFTALPNTPAVNGFTPALLTSNPNLNSANGAGATNPFRLDRSQAHTSSQNHAYGPEQAAFDDGRMDLFPKNTGAAGTGGTGVFNTKGLVMGYYDGNTVTALWNYAQHFAMSDNSYSTNFGPSTPGAVNLISGQTNGAVGFAPSNGSSSNTINNIVADGQGGFTMYGDSDPHGDVCSSTTNATTEMTGKNVGDLLNAKNISWGWFQGGFDLTAVNVNGSDQLHAQFDLRDGRQQRRTTTVRTISRSSTMPRPAIPVIRGRPRRPRSARPSTAAPTISTTSPTSSPRCRPATCRRSASSRRRRSRTPIPAIPIRSTNRPSSSTSSTCCSRARNGAARR